MSSHPNINHIINPPSGKSYCLEPLTADNLNEACDVLSKLYCSTDPLCVAMNITKESFHDLCKAICQISLLDNLGVVCKDTSDSRIVGACIVCDNTRDLNSDEHFKELKSSDVKGLAQLAKEFKNNIPATQRGENLCIYFLGVDKDLKEETLASEILKWVIWLHPSVSHALVTYMYCTSPWTQKAAKEVGLKTVETVQAEKIVNNKGDKPYLQLNESLKKLGVENYEGIQLVKRDKQQILDELFDIDFTKNA